MAAAAAIGISCIVLTGWFTGVRSLTSILPGAASMNSNAAFCIAALGCAIWLVAADDGKEHRLHRFVIAALASLVAVIAFLTLLQAVSGIDLQVQRFVSDFASRPGELVPGRMSPINASALFLLSVGLLIRSYGDRHSIRLAEWCALVAGFVGFAEALAYMFGVNTLRAGQVYRTLPLHSAIALLLLAVGFLCSNPHFAIRRRFQSVDASGVLARRLLPAAILVPPLLGWARLLGQEQGWYSHELGAAMFSLAIVVVFADLVWLTVRDVGRADRERRHAERRLRSKVARLKLLSQITRAIALRQDLQSIFGIVARSVADNLPVDLCAIVVRDAATGVVTVASLVASREQGSTDALVVGERLESDGSGLDRSLRGDVVYEENTAAIPLEFTQRLARAGLLSIVIAPLRAETSIFGVLIAARRQQSAFDSTASEFLTQLAEQVALASHQAQLNAALKEAYDRLQATQNGLMQQERLRALAEMASGVAHDINNAITPVTLYTELLIEEEKSLSPRGREYLGIIQRVIGNVASTVTRMREFSRPSLLPTAFEAVDLNATAREVAELTRPAWKDQVQQRGSRIRLQLELGPDPLNVPGSKQEIRDALANLVLNAVDAMPKGGTLTIRTQQQDKCVLIEVIDTGQGMTDETRRHCLEPFYTTKGERGTGLGLAMVYGTVQRHHAKLEIDSEVGVGTTMRMRFASGGAQIQAIAPQEEPVPSVGSLRILAIDDDPLVREALRYVLEVDGHVVTEADGGAEGITAFENAIQQRTVFDIVITDLGMPDIDGRQVAAKVKSISPATPVIMLTGWGQRMLADHELPEHVDHMLGKPPGLKELRTALWEMRKAS